ncbi:MAG: glycosyltransferase [Candidatus Sumerlaeota bacterium]
MDRRLNILRVITWLPVGGIERKILAVLPRLDHERFNVRLVCIREEGVLAEELRREGIPVDVVPMRTRLSPSGLLRLSKYLGHHKIDIVHSHMYRSNVPATISSRIAGIKGVICQVHNVDTWESRRQRIMDRFLCRWRSVMVGVSERVRRDMIETLGIPESMTRVIYNGAEIGRFQDRSRREQTRRELGIDPDCLVVIYHGRLVRQKNPDVLVRIADEIIKPRAKALMLVVGDGGCREQMEATAREKKLGDIIRFTGKRDDIPDLLNAADMAVLPSYKEGFSNSLVESLAAGLPTVATDVGGNAEAIEDGRSGIIVPPHENDLLLEKLGWLAEHPDVRRKMGRAAAERAERFSLRRMVEAVENLYIEVAKENGILPEGGKNGIQ